MIDSDRETQVRRRIFRLRRALQQCEDELEDIHRGTTGTFGRLRYGDRVRLTVDYGEHSTAKIGEIGTVGNVFTDGQVVVNFQENSLGDHRSACYWPAVLEWVPETEVIT